jgi:hypothetical protein
MASKINPIDYINSDEVIRAIKLFHYPGDVIEIRIPTQQKSRTISGYFDDPEKLADAIETPPTWNMAGFYFTPNEINRVLLARSVNRLQDYAPHTTSDADVTRLKWMLIDFDVRRPAGISSTDDEHDAAIMKAREAMRTLMEDQGWPKDAFVLADSGNGGHLNVRIDLENTPENITLLKRCLETLDYQLSDEMVHVDLTTYNPSRIWKLYGTVAAKGDATPERPHRFSKVLETPETLVAVSREMLEGLAGVIPDQQETPVKGDHDWVEYSKKFDPAKYAEEHGAKVLRTKSWTDPQGKRWDIAVLEECPFDPNHRPGKARISVCETGARSFRCFHHGCSGRRWQDLKAKWDGGSPESLPSSQLRVENNVTGDSCTIAINAGPAGLQPAVCPRPVTAPALDGAKELVAEMLEKTRSDVGAPFLEAYVEAMAVLFIEDKVAYQSAKGELKKLGVGIRDLNREIKQKIIQINKSKSQHQGKTDGRLPQIQVNNRQLRDVTQDAIREMVNANTPPVLFERNGSIATVKYTDKGHILKNLDVADVRNFLSKCADWVTVSANFDEGVIVSNTFPPRDVVEDVIHEGRWPGLPSIVNIIETPTVRDDGSIITEPGYDEDTGLYYIPADDIIGLELPDNPTQADAKQAAEYVMTELFFDFPFDDDSSCAHLVACMLTIIARPVIKGATPMLLIDKPTMGTGSSLLAEVISVVTRGKPATMIAAPSENEEWRKMITAHLIGGPQLLILDNLSGVLKSSKLSEVLTALEWKDRILGKTDTVVLPTTAVWVGTGNNVQIAGDMKRRVYRCRLDAKTPQPWLAKKPEELRHKDLLIWTGAHRREILVALLTMIKAWVQAGRPKPDNPAPVLGKYEQWCPVVDGIMSYAGITGFLGNLDDMYSDMGSDAEDVDDFFEAWYEVWGEKSITAKTLCDALGSLRPEFFKLNDALPDRLQDAVRSHKTMGRRLSMIKGITSESGYRLISSSDNHAKTKLWKIEIVKSAPLATYVKKYRMEVVGWVGKHYENRSRRNSEAARYRLRVDAKRRKMSIAYRLRVYAGSQNHLKLAGKENILFLEKNNLLYSSIMAGGTTRNYPQSTSNGSISPFAITPQTISGDLIVSPDTEIQVSPPQTTINTFLLGRGGVESRNYFASGFALIPYYGI